MTRKEQIQQVLANKEEAIKLKKIGVKFGHGFSAKPTIDQLIKQRCQKIVMM
jgi:hypothetical protein